MGWERFDECYDAYNGGAIYVRDNADGSYDAVGTFWLDGGKDDLHYVAEMCRFYQGQTTYDDVLVNNVYDAATAFSGAIDGDIEQSLGWFATMAEAEAAVEDAVATYLA